MPKNSVSKGGEKIVHNERMRITGSPSSMCIADYELQRFVWESNGFVLNGRNSSDFSIKSSYRHALSYSLLFVYFSS